MTPATFPDATYILPIRRDGSAADADLDAYLAWLWDNISEVIVVDASPASVFEDHAARWQGVIHVCPDPRIHAANGKVRGVLTGLNLASHDNIVIGDDDVRYDAASLERVLRLLDEAEVVRPQNYFTSHSWHCLWDTGRTLLNRISGGDWPGTLAVRRQVLMDAGGYDGDCLFENLELVRTVQAAGGRERLAQDLFVARRPPTARHFWSQRVRQAYDEFARPGRLLFQTTWLPVLAATTLRLPRVLPLLALGAMALAEAGRRRDGGQDVFPVTASLMAPAWVAERSVAVWLALVMRVLYGGVRYRGGVIHLAAHQVRDLQKHQSERAMAS